MASSHVVSRYFESWRRPCRCQTLVALTSPTLRHAALSPLHIHRSSSLVLIITYRLVLETLNPLPEDRKCFRMINGVLVERTVKDVIPALKTNADGLKKVLDDLVKSYKLKQDELETWKVRHA